MAKITSYHKGANKGAILEVSKSHYVAVLASSSKAFKTKAGAEKHLLKYGYKRG